MGKFIDFWKERSNQLSNQLFGSEEEYASYDSYQSNASTAPELKIEPTQVVDHSTTDAQIVVLDRLSRKDTARIADFIGGNKMVVLNLSSTEEADRQRILDFVSGFIYSEQGKLAKINEHSYIAVPSYVNLYGTFGENDESLFAQLTNIINSQTANPF